MQCEGWAIWQVECLEEAEQTIKWVPYSQRAQWRATGRHDGYFEDLDLCEGCVEMLDDGEPNECFSFEGEK